MQGKKRGICVLLAAFTLLFLLLSGAFAAKAPTENETVETFVNEQLNGVYSGPIPIKPIAWLSANQNRFPTGLLESQVGFSDHRAFTYDQALAAIAFTEAGDYARARKIFNRMRLLQHSTGYWRSAFYATNGSVWDWSIGTGPIAWMVIAINYYEAKTNDKSYAAAAEKAVKWLETRIDTNPASGSYGALNLGDNLGNAPNSGKAYSTEHQFDAYSAFKNRAALTRDSTLKTRLNSEAENILAYLVRQPWRGNHFDRGYKDAEKWLDAQSWAAMALGNRGPNGEDFAAALNYAYSSMRRTKNYSQSIANVEGFSYNNYWDTVWVEGTLQMAAAYYLSGDSAKGNYFMGEMARTVRQDGGLPYSFDASGTREDNWPMNLRYSAVSSITWYYFAQQKFNPFKAEIPGTPEPSACYKSTDCGTDSWIGALSCSNGDVVQAYRTYACINPGTPNASCSHNDELKLKQDCGETSCNRFGGKYCKGSSLYQSRMCFERGCNSGACFGKLVRDEELVEACQHGCMGNACIAPECLSDTDCGTNEWVRFQMCRGQDVYQYFRTHSCSNARCRYADVLTLKEDCGENTYDPWSEPYCQSGNVVKSRTIYIRGCYAGACRVTDRSETQVIERCLDGCGNGKCASQEAPELECPNEPVGPDYIFIWEKGGYSIFFIQFSYTPDFRSGTYLSMYAAYSSQYSIARNYSLLARYAAMGSDGRLYARVYAWKGTKKAYSNTCEFRLTP